MSDIITAIIVLLFAFLFLREYPVLLILIATAIVCVLVVAIAKKQKEKREQAERAWRREQEQKEIEHKRYLEEQERQKRIREREKREKRLQEQKRNVAEREQQERLQEPKNEYYRTYATGKNKKEFSFDEAIDVYLKTDHKSCKAIYDYNTYFRDAFYCILQGLTQYEIKLSDEKVLRQNEIDNPIEETKNITKATKLEKLRDFIAIDTETTGLKCGGNDIIEICAIKFLDFRPTEKFHTYLRPRKSIPDSATEINGITDDMVRDAPKFSQIKSSLQEFIGDLPLVAHNARFDMKFLHVSGLDLEKHENKVYDTLKLSKLKLRDYDGSKFESYKLCDLCDELNISCNTFHSADSDTLACGLLFIEIIKAIREVDSIDDFN